MCWPVAGDTLEAARYHSGRGGPTPRCGTAAGTATACVDRRREVVVSRIPQHVTMRVRRGLPTLCQPRFVRRFRASLSQICERDDFRVIHYSIQSDHVHLLIEATDKAAIARGIKCIGARLGKLVNRLFRQTGKVLDGRHAASMARIFRPWPYSFERRSVAPTCHALDAIAVSIGRSSMCE